METPVRNNLRPSTPVKLSSAQADLNAVLSDVGFSSRYPIAYGCLVRAALHVRHAIDEISKEKGTR